MVKYYIFQKYYSLLVLYFSTPDTSLLCNFTSYHNQNLEENMSVNIFVYGTLKTGEPNHYWFQEASANNGARVDLVGAGITLEKLPLIVATEFNIPMLLGWLNNIYLTLSL